MSLSDKSSDETLLAHELGFETINAEDLCSNLTESVGSEAVDESQRVSGDTSETEDGAEDGAVWLKLEKDDAGFSVSLLDTSDEAAGRSR